MNLPSIGRTTVVPGIGDQDTADSRADQTIRRDRGNAAVSFTLGGDSQRASAGRSGGGTGRSGGQRLNASGRGQILNIVV